MSRYQGTLLPSALEDKKVEEETRKAVLDLLKKVNEIYTELLPESGTNNDGYYTKFFDGTLIQAGSARVTTNALFGTNYYATVETAVTFPIPFHGLPFSIQATTAATISVGATYVSNRSGANPVSSKGFGVNVWMTDNIAYTVYWTAYGRWK